MHEDFREVQHGYEMLNQFMGDESRLKAFKGGLDAHAPGAAEEALSNFRQWTVGHSPHSIHFNTYVASVSEHFERDDRHGRLSMWRAFGQQPSRVALLLKIPFFTGVAEKLNLFFSPVAYLDQKQVLEVIDEVIANIVRGSDVLQTLDKQRIINAVFMMMLAGVTCLKHEGFEEEREWRAIYAPKLFHSPLMQQSTRFFDSVPQQVYELPFDKSVSPEIAPLDFAEVFDGLIVGPTQYPLAMVNVFIDALGAAGIPADKHKIIVSNIPIRS